MKAKLLEDGCLSIVSESIDDDYILQYWVELNHDKEMKECVRVKMDIHGR